MKTPHKEPKDKKITEVPAHGKNRKSTGQTNGQFERDSKHGTGQYSGAGDPPLMKK